MLDLKNFSTIVIVDIETSSLQNDAEILEIALWAISENVWSNSIANPNFNFKTPHRISEIISILFQPRRNINLKASEVNGLQKENLETKPYMSKESLQPIINFINNLKKPCLFIAHNGFLFDYKHLMRCMKACDVVFGGEECYFGDSLIEFRKTRTSKNYQLETLYKKYVTKDFIQKHTALDDCEKLSILLQNRWEIMLEIARNAKPFNHMYEMKTKPRITKNYNPTFIITASSPEDTEYQFLMRYRERYRQKKIRQTEEPKFKKKKIVLDSQKIPKRRHKKWQYKRCAL